MMRVHIAHVEISPAMASKIMSKHGVTPYEVREACSAVERAAWDYHPKHGRRLLVEGRTVRGRVLKVILQPVDTADGSWRLRTALDARKG